MLYSPPSARTRPSGKTADAKYSGPYPLGSEPVADQVPVTYWPFLSGVRRYQLEVRDVLPQSCTSTVPSVSRRGLHSPAVPGIPTDDSVDHVPPASSGGAVVSIAAIAMQDAAMTRSDDRIFDEEIMGKPRV